ncbi:MAG TPA: hypothetical protein VHX11_09095 [Acidobacteriaceae bacterium]|jgi:hypothetical protein|nr:hypothetical protein [Acidobacteriaceae bacterium]
MLRTALVALLLVAAPAARVRSAIHLGQDIAVAPEQEIRSAVCFLCSVRLDGAARSNLIVFAGNVYLNGPVHRDVVDVGGNVTMTGNAQVSGTLIVFGGHLFRDPAASISRGTVVVRPIVFLPIILVLGLAIYGLIFLLRSLLPQDRSF